jgi:hypothetical protein
MKNRKLMTLIILALTLSMGVRASLEREGEKFLEPGFKYLLIRPLINVIGIAIPQAIWIRNEGLSFADNCDRAILYNPPVETALPFMNMILRILLPVFSLLIVSIGLYLLVLSSSPKGRVRAKSMLGRLMITMVLVSVSPLITRIVFSISSGLTEGIFSLVSMTLIKDILRGGMHGVMVLTTWLMTPEAVLGLIPFILTFVFSWMPYLVISLRNIVLTALMIALPLGILLYSIPSLKSIGKTILEQFLVWTFLQSFMALGLVSVAKAFSTINLNPNPTINCLHTEMIGTAALVSTGGTAAIIIAVLSILGEVIGISGAVIPFISTDLKTLGFGIVAYAIVFVSPLLMVAMFKKFLP